jgi:hypothetical protein
MRVAFRSVVVSFGAALLLAVPAAAAPAAAAPAHAPVRGSALICCSQLHDALVLDL